VSWSFTVPVPFWSNGRSWASPPTHRTAGPKAAPGLEDGIAERHERLVALTRESATEVPTLADIAPLLDRLLILATSLDAAPQGELRALLDALQLEVVYQPGDRALDVAVTLYDGGGDTGAAVAQVGAEDWLAPPAVAPPAVRAPGLPECEPRTFGGGPVDQPGGSAHPGPP